MAGVDSLDTLLVGTLLRYGPLSDEDLWRQAPADETGTSVERSELSRWLDSAQRRNLVRARAGPGGIPVFEATEEGRQRLEG